MKPYAGPKQAPIQFGRSAMVPQPDDKRAAIPRSAGTTLNRIPIIELGVMGLQPCIDHTQCPLANGLVVLRMPTGPLLPLRRRVYLKAPRKGNTLRRAAKEDLLLHYRQFARDLGYPHNKPSIMLTDNMSSIKLSKALLIPSLSQSIDLKHHHVRWAH
jgi:hypothetical protein